jgi:peptidoglycan/LPS O-acetylase OafA/YrhL
MEGENITKNLDKKFGISCSKQLVAIFVVLYLLVVIMVGTVMDKGGDSSNKNVGWVLFTFALLFGLAGLVCLYFTSGTNFTSARLAFVILSVISSISFLSAMIIVKPKLDIGQLFTPHFANVLFGIVAAIITIIMTPSDKYYTNKALKTLYNNKNQNQIINQETVLKCFAKLKAKESCIEEKK